MKTVELINIYKVVEGNLKTEQIEKSKLKNYVGWKLDMEEALLTKYNHANLNVQNNVTELNKLVVELLEVKSLLDEVGINFKDMPEKSAYGLSLDSIDKLVGNLIKLSN